MPDFFFQTLSLTLPLFSHEWFNHVDVPEGVRLEYRYFVCQFLDPYKDNCVQREMVITRWETNLKPRSLMPEIECGPNRHFSRTKAESFGQYGKLPRMKMICFHSCHYCHSSKCQVVMNFPMMVGCWVKVRFVFAFMAMRSNSGSRDINRNFIE